VLLQQLEEVLSLDAAILGHVRAVNGVPNSVLSELSSNGVGAQMSSNFGVMRTAKLPECGYGVLLTNLEGDDGAARKVLDDGKVLWQNTLVDLVEFLDDSTVHHEELHTADLKTGLQNHLDHLTSLALALDVRLNEAERAVIKHSSGLHGSLNRLLASKPEIMLALV